MRDTNATRMRFETPAEHLGEGFAGTLSDTRHRVELESMRGWAAYCDANKPSSQVDGLDSPIVDLDPRRQSRTDLEREFTIRVRRTFTLINESRLMCVAGSVTPRRGVVSHADVLQAVIDDAQDCFDLAAKIGTQDARGHADKQHCLRDLRAVSYALRVGEPPPARELAHAMDGLIVLFVQLLPSGAMRFEVGSTSSELDLDSRAFAWR
jgi:hypothetical protein